MNSSKGKAAEATIKAIDPTVKIDGEVVSSPEIVAEREAKADIAALAREVEELAFNFTEEDRIALVRDALHEAGMPGSQSGSFARKMANALVKRGLA